MELSTGIKGYKRSSVTPNDLATSAGSGNVPVYASPYMIAMMEACCWESVAECLDSNQSTVGTAFHIEHISATPSGVDVWCESELIEIDRRKLVFRVTAYDPAGVIGRGTHERFIVDKERFLEKAEQKKASGSAEK